MDRRVCLMQDPIYRLDVAMTAMGYTQVPMASVCFEATAPNLNLTAMEVDAGQSVCRIVVSAPMDRGVSGTLTLVADGIAVEPSRFEVDVAPGQRVTHLSKVAADGSSPRQGNVRAMLAGKGLTLRGEVDVRVAGKPLEDGIVVQAEDFTAQVGGKVQVRTDKAGVVGKAISHWDDKGHSLSWRIRCPTGRYHLVIRYSASKDARRAVFANDRKLADQTFVGTGGFGSLASEWDHAAIADAKGKTVTLTFDKGDHTIRLENTDGVGLNLDYLALVPIR